MLPFKRGAFHLAVQAQVRQSFSSTHPWQRGIGTHPGAGGWGTLGSSGVCRAQGGVRDLLKPRAQQELESVWRTPLTPYLLQVPIFPIVISPYWDFFSSKDKKFTSGKWKRRSPAAGGKIWWWGWGPQGMKVSGRHVGRQPVVGDAGGKTSLLGGLSSSLLGLSPLSPGTCTIQVLPKIETQGLSLKDVPELTETVRKAMVDVFSEMAANQRGDQRAEHPPLPCCAGATKGTGSPWHMGDTAGSSD